MADKESFGEMLVRSLHEAVSHSRGEMKARVERVSLGARKPDVSPSRPMETAPRPSRKK